MPLAIVFLVHATARCSHIVRHSAFCKEFQTVNQ